MLRGSEGFSLCALSVINTKVNAGVWNFFPACHTENPHSACSVTALCIKITVVISEFKRLAIKISYWKLSKQYMPLVSSTREAAGAGGTIKPVS